MNSVKKNYLGKLLFFIPAIFVFGYGIIYPFIRLFIVSLQKSVDGKIIFGGLDSYKRVLGDSVFFDAIRNNMILIAVVVPLLIWSCLVFSIMIYNLGRGSKFFQVVIFIPYILSITATGILFSILLQKNGIINEFFRKIGLDFLAVDWLGNSKVAIFTIALIVVWKELGFGTMLFLSRLEALPEELVDATKIDGANKWQTLLNLYIPHLKGVIVFYITLVIISMLSWVFNYVFVMTGGANNTMVFEIYVYRQLFLYFNRWGGSAAAVLISLIVVVVIFFQMKSRLGLDEDG